MILGKFLENIEEILKKSWNLFMDIGEMEKICRKIKLKFIVNSEESSNSVKEILEKIWKFFLEIL